MFMNGSEGGPSGDERRLLLQFIYDAHVRLEASSTDLDKKAGVLLGFAALCLSLGLSFGLPICRSALLLAFTATWSALLFGSVLFLAAALMPTSRIEAPAPGVIFRAYSALEFDQIYQGLGGDFSETWEENRRSHERKAHRTRLAIRLLVIGLVVFALDILAVRPAVDCARIGEVMKQHATKEAPGEAAIYEENPDQGEEEAIAPAADIPDPH